MTVVFVAASGTGGHILPAVYIARELKELGAEVIFFGSGKPLEKKLIEDFHIVALSVSGIAGLGFVGFIKFLLSVPSSAFIIFREYLKNRPFAVLGVGGYVSVLPILIGRIFGIKTWIHEAENHFGLANRLLRFFAHNISSAHPDLPCSIYTGHPVRSDLKNITPNTCEEPKKLLVLGGSQGALTLDQTVPEIIPKGLEVHHQAREENLSKVSALYKERGINALVVPFFKDLTAEYSWADIIISRAGAGSVMEISFTNRPTIFVPFPFAQGNHQKENAEKLKAKSLIVEEGEDFKERLSNALNKLLQKEFYKQIKDSKFTPPPIDAAKKIAEMIMKRAGRRDLTWGSGREA